MSNGQTKITFGNRQARSLCNMAQEARLDFIAEGLPIILGSARSFWNAAKQLGENPREASVLEGFSEEEAAKALILLDIVRCPPAKVSGRIGRVVKKVFYDHLARMIYAKAQSWKPVHVAQLQEYIDQERQGHYLEGGMSEYIVPNWSIYNRESSMYADIEVYEDGIAQWSDPNSRCGLTWHQRPIALGLIEALNALGIFTRPGLQATSDVWGKLDFHGQQSHSDARELADQLARRLDTEGLVSEAATDADVRLFYDFWQLPMYNLNFEMIDMPLEELSAARDAAFWNEVGS
jgi:hypothetical protein